ncbi:MAG: hypothetical protein RLZZ517_503 [Candidatus Parcubacteria bacterium]|jgi:predicted transcriptional regulator
MKIKPETLKILGISRVELQILNSLDSKDLTILDISKQTSIPRTSLYYTLSLLQERGFISKYKLHKKILWKKTEDSKIKELLQEATVNFTQSQVNTTTQTVDTTTSITFYRGVSDMISFFNELVQTPKESRWYGIQPGPSVIDLLSKANVQNIIDFNHQVKNKKHIVEGVVHEGYIEIMANILAPKEYKDLLKSFGGRSADYAKLPENYMKDISSEIYLFDNTKIALLNWNKEFAIIIRNKDMYDLLFEMFKSTKYMLNKYDQNEKIAKKLVELG